MIRAKKQFYHDIDLVKVGQLVDARIQNLTSAEISTLADELDADNIGLVVFDTTINTLRIWDGTAFSNVSADIEGDIIFKGVINPTNADSVEKAKGYQYVVDTEGQMTFGGTTHDVEVGDIVLFTSATEATVFNRNIDAASTEAAGIVEIATQAEVDDRTDTSRVITPATLANSWLASDVAQNTQDISDNATDITSLQNFTGEGTPLSTAADDLAEAINELVLRADSDTAEIDALEAFVGEGIPLSTNASDLAGAVNELKGRADSADSRMTSTEGDVSSLQTFTGEGTPLDTVADDLAAAINELHGEVVANDSDIAANAASIESNANAIAANTAAIEANDSDIAALDVRITSVEASIGDRVDSDIAALQAQVTSNDTDITGIIARLDSDDADIATLKGEMDAAEGRLDVNEGDIDALEVRMDSAESRLTAAEGRLTVNEGDIDDLEAAVGTIGSLATTATDLVAAINELHGEINSNDTDIAQNASDISSLQNFTGEGVVTLATDATTLSGAVNELQAEIEGNDSDIAALSGRLDVLEARDHIKVHNSTVAVTAGVPRPVSHNLGLASAANFVVNVMDSDNSQISVDIDAVDANTINIRSLVDLTGVKVTVMGK